MDLRVYMQLMGLLIAIVAVVGYFVLSAALRAHARQRGAMENRWRPGRHWEG